jgi:hypothetical protein
VGGGNGALLLPVVERHPAMRLTVFDLPHVADAARARIAAAGLSDRCDAVGCEAFVAVPSGADAYVLKGVIHDWDDKDAIAILRTCRSAMPDGARLLLIERVLPELIDPNDAATQERFIADIQMFVNPGGRERTEAEFRDQLTQAGLRLTRIVNPTAPQASWRSISPDPRPRSSNGPICGSYRAGRNSRTTLGHVTASFLHGRALPSVLGSNNDNLAVC